MTANGYGDLGFFFFFLDYENVLELDNLLVVQP